MTVTHVLENMQRNVVYLWEKIKYSIMCSGVTKYSVSVSVSIEKQVHVLYSFCQKRHRYPQYIAPPAGSVFQKNETCCVHILRLDLNEVNLFSNGPSFQSQVLSVQHHDFMSEPFKAFSRLATK